MAIVLARPNHFRPAGSDDDDDNEAMRDEKCNACNETSIDDDDEGFVTTGPASGTFARRA